jgi:hypothetical protein
MGTKYQLGKQNGRYLLIDLNIDDRIVQFFILAINQLDAKILSYSKFIICLYMFRAPGAHHQEVKIALYSLWYHHTYNQRLYNTILSS